MTKIERLILQAASLSLRANAIATVHHSPMPASIPRLLVRMIATADEIDVRLEQASSGKMFRIKAAIVG